MTLTNDAIFICSGVWNPPSPTRQRRTAPSNRAMAPQPAPSNPILRTPKQSRQRQPRTRRTGAAGDTHRFPGRRGRRGHAPGALPDRQIPHRPAVPVQSATDPGVADGRRPGADPEWPAVRDGLAHRARHLPTDEELYSHQIRFLLAVSIPPQTRTHIYTGL